MAIWVQTGTEVLQRDVVDDGIGHQRLVVVRFIASRVVNQRGEGCILNIALGILGALVGGFIFSRLFSSIR